MKKQMIGWISSLAASAAMPLLVSAASPFGNESLLIVRSGDATTASLGGNAAPAYLDEINVVGTPIQTLALGNYAAVDPTFTLAGENHSGGFISRSYNGQYFVLGGYWAPVNTPTVIANDSSAVPRTIARIDMSGNIDTSTKLGDLSGNELRSVATNDGTTFWSNGTGNSNQLRYSVLGAVTSARISTNSNLGSRVINIFADPVGDAQVYMSRSNAGRSITAHTRAVDPNPKLPVTGNTTATDLFANASSTNPSPYDYVLLGGDTLYITDDNDNPDVGGIQKWTRSGSTWTKQYVLNDELTGIAGSKSLRGITALKHDDGSVTLYATTGSGKFVVSVIDFGEASPFQLVATAADGTTFHDVVAVPEPASLSLLALAGGLLLKRRRGLVRG